MNAVTTSPSVGRPQFLGLLQERMVQRLAEPVVLRGVLKKALGRAAVVDGDPELVLRAAVLDSVRRPAHVMALYEAARGAPPELDSTDLGFLGVAEAFGSGLAHVKLVELARGDDVASRAAREILRYSKTMRVAARLPYSLQCVALFERIKNDFFMRLAAQLNRQTDRPELLRLWSDLLHGPFHVIRLMCQLVPNGATSPGEITEAKRVYHDCLGTDLHTLLILYESVKEAPERLTDARLQSYLSPKVSKEWDAFLSAAVTREAIAARDAGLQWQWRVYGHDQLSAGFASQECALIIREFVRNAIKYVDRTKPDCWIRISWDAAMRTLAIADNGVGIANTTTVWKHGTRERPDLAAGTGLGLYSLRRRAEANGWAVSVTSTPGEGSAFTLQLKPSDFAVPTR